MSPDSKNYTGISSDYAQSSKQIVSESVRASASCIHCQRQATLQPSEIGWPIPSGAHLQRDHLAKLSTFYLVSNQI